MTGDSRSEADVRYGYGIPHLIARGTRHEAVGQAAIAGRTAPDRYGGGVLEFTKRVTHFTDNPPNHRRVRADGGSLKTMAAEVRCPDCGATHVRPEYVRGGDRPDTIEGECYAPHPERGADFEGCGETVELEVVEWRETATDGGQRRLDDPNWDEEQTALDDHADDSAPDLPLTPCRACEGLCVGEYCSDECRHYWETRDQQL